MNTAWLSRNWFVFGIVVAVTLGIAFPAVDSLLNPHSGTTNTLIIALFLISGLTLPSEAIVHGLRNYRMHLYILLFIFVLVPAYFYLTSTMLFGTSDESLLAGIFGLAVLPTTVSSCIVFTQVSGGNMVATMFNASVANILGVFISPLLLSLLLQGSHAALPPEQIVATLKGLVLKMLLPIAAGQILRLFLARFATEHRKKLGNVSNSFILIIVFFSLAHTATNPAFVSGLASMVLPFFYLAVSHVILVALAYGGAKLQGYSKADTISVLYAAPQKTLALGVPLLTAYFATRPEILGYALLPLLFYHPWQLIVAGFLRSHPFMKQESVPVRESR